VILTTFDPKPIPDCRFDWSAATSDYEPGHPVGYGATEGQAFADLFEQLPDAAHGCERKCFVTRRCERGTDGCDILHDYNPTIEQLLDKLHAAGVEVIVNTTEAP
jgi:hypothetical protein